MQVGCSIWKFSVDVTSVHDTVHDLFPSKYPQVTGPDLLVVRSGRKIIHMRIKILILHDSESIQRK